MSLIEVIGFIIVVQNLFAYAINVLTYLRLNTEPVVQPPPPPVVEEGEEKQDENDSVCSNESTSCCELSHIHDNIVHFEFPFYRK